MSKYGELEDNHRPIENIAAAGSPLVYDSLILGNICFSNLDNDFLEEFKLRR